MAIQEKIIAQVRPSSTDVSSVYLPATGTTAIVKSIVICNTSTSSLTFDIYNPLVGSSLGALGEMAGALHFETAIAAKTTVYVDSFMGIEGNDVTDFQVKASAANAISFTFYGAEIT